MKDMTVPEKVFAEAYLKNNANGVEAAKSVSRTENRASLARLAWRYLQRPGVQQHLKEAMQEVGYDRSRVLKKLNKRLMSTVESGRIQEVVALTRTADNLARKSEEDSNEKWNRKVKMIAETDFAVSQLNIGVPEPFEKLFGVIFEKKSPKEMVPLQELPLSSTT